MAPERKRRRGAAGASVLTRKKAKPVRSYDKVVRALIRKSRLPPAEQDTLDYEEFNKEHLVLATDVTLANYEMRAQGQRILLLVAGQCMCVESDFDAARAIEQVGYEMSCRAAGAILGCPLTLDASSSHARAASQMFYVEGKGAESRLKTSADGRVTEWPTGVFSVAKSRTLAELIEDAFEFMKPSEQGCTVRFYLGIKHYEPTGQLIAFVVEKSTDGTVTLSQAVSFGTAAPAQSTVDVLRAYGGPQLRLRGVGFRDDIPCNQLGIATYQLNLKSELVFGGEVPDCYPSEGINLDLHYLQTLLLKKDYSQAGYLSGTLRLCTGCESCLEGGRPRYPPAIPDSDDED